MGNSRAIRQLVILSLACVLFAGGYWIQRRWDEGNLWHGNVPAVSVDSSDAAFGSESKLAPNGSGILFDDIARESGIDFSYYDGAEGKLYIVETTGGGVGVIDFDNDGRLDFFFTNGMRLRPDRSDETHTARLYANRANQRFENVSRSAGVDLIAYAQGATVTDYDNDGLDDLFVTCFGETVLYHNVGDGTFVQVTEAAGVSSDRWSTSAAAADLDSDGDLDLYVCSYGVVALEQVLECVHKGVPIHCGPQKYQPQPDLLFQNLGDGTFREMGREAGIDDDTGRGLAVAIADLTGDDRPDVFVANDSSQHFLFVNQGGFHFQESGLSLGTALNSAGHYMAGMSAACADYDHNGWLDLFVTNFYGSRSALYRHLGSAGFFDHADVAGLAAPSSDRLGFGSSFIDADLDGHPDLVVANGHVSNLTSVGIPYKMRQQFFRNRGDGKFLDESESAGAYFQRQVLGRGVACADVDDDGRSDVVICHIGDPAALLMNRTQPHGHWLGLQLVGTQSNRQGTNVKVHAALPDRTQHYELIAGGTYLSTSDRRIIVGLGSLQQVDSLEIEWPSGRRQHGLEVQTDRYHRIVEPVEDKKSEH